MWFFSNIATDRVENIYLNFESGENENVSKSHITEKCIGYWFSFSGKFYRLYIEKNVFIAHMSIT